MVAMAVGLALASASLTARLRAPPPVRAGALRMQQKFGSALCPLLDDVPTTPTCESLTFGMG